MSRWLTGATALIGLAALAGSVASAEEVVIRDAAGEATTIYSASHALVIGAADYEHRSWNDLPRVRDEVDEVASTLRVHGFNVETVLDPSGDELRTAIRRFVVQHGFTRVNADNRLLVFFSGHGHTRLNDRGYLVPVDAPDPFLDEPGFLDKALDMIEVIGWAERIEAKHALFVFDSCFSGTLFETRAQSRPGEAYIRASTAKPVRQFITAGRADEEVPAASIFTPQFLKALEGDADTNDDGYVTGVELGLYLMQTVPDYNPAQTPQYGKIRNVRLDKGDFVFEAREASQPNAVEVTTWERTFGGSWHSLKAITAPADDGFLLAGRGNLGDYDWLLKIDRDGRELWRRTYEDEGYYDLEAITAAPAGEGFLLAGSTISEEWGNTGWLLKVDRDGRELWRRTFEGRGRLYGIIAADDGGFLLAGYIASEDTGDFDGWLLKVDRNGRELWRRTFREFRENDDDLTAITAAGDGGFLLAGSSGDGRNTGWLLKVDRDGRELWRRTYERNWYDALTAVIAAGDGGFLLAGGTQNEDGGDFDGRLLKVDQDGRELWRRTFKGRGSLNGITAADDGGFLLAGFIESEDTGDFDGWLLKVDQDGRELWRRTFGGSGNEGLTAITAAGDGGFLLAGVTRSIDEDVVDSDGWLLKVDRNGMIRSETVADR
jgi:hypothetical protein